MTRNTMNLYSALCSLPILAFGLIFSPSVDARGGMSIFDGPPTEEQCRSCHDDLNQFPMLNDTNANRHHVLIGTPIPPLWESKAPDAFGGVAGDPYQCQSCHDIHLLETVRNCLQCHPEWRVTGNPMRGYNVHHETETFQNRQCNVCHNRGGSSGGGGGMGSGRMGGGMRGR